MGFITQFIQSLVEVVQDTHDDLNANANLQIGDADVDASNPVFVTLTDSDWTPTSAADEGANDSDKTILVPASTQWHFLSVRVELTTTATVGDRQIVLQLLDDSSDVIGEVRAGVVQAASLTRYYEFSPPCADLLGFRDTDWLMTPLPFWVAPAAWGLRVYDNNAVDAAADDMIVQMNIAVRNT